MVKKSELVVKKDARIISPSYTRSYPLVIDKAKDCWVWDIDGKKYLDFSSFIAVSNVGHSNPEVVKAVKTQADKCIHNAGTDFYNELEVKLAGELVKITPGNFAKRVFFTNSGTESVECAFKLARWYKKKYRMIAFLDAFHGRTMGSLSLTASKPIHRDHFSPLVPGVTHVPFAYCYRCAFSKEYPICEMECLKYLEDEILKTIVPTDEVAAVIVEPIQGEGGYIVPPKDYHKNLQKICKRNNFLYIADEIQTGFGRTGYMFASEYFGVKPDIICLAKGIANGLPLGACVAKKNIMVWPPGAHASTFSGNPLSCAAALSSIDQIKTRKLCKNAERLGKIGMKFLKDLKEEVEIVGDVRGMGLMLAMELVKDKKSKIPAKKEVEKVLHHAFRHGLILLSCGTSTIRIVPPLTITREDFEKGLDMLESVVKKI
jgi:4-aminobutyrate aminotransferase